MLERLGLRLRVFLFFAALALGSVAAMGAGLWAGYRKIGDPGALPGFVLAGIIAGFAILALVVWVWFLFDENVARAILRLAGGMRAQAHTEGSAIAPQAGRYLGDLAPAAIAISESLDAARDALAEAVGRETTRLAAEKTRLEVLLSDITEGVLLCSQDHQLVFYNGMAEDMLGVGQAVGLDRGVFDFLREAPLRHAYGRLCAGDDSEAVSDLLCTTTAGGRVLSGRMRLLTGQGLRPGYVLTLRDVTGDLAAHTARDHLMDQVFDRIRRPAANLGSVIGLMSEDEDLRRDPKLGAALLDEAGRLATALHELGARHDALRGSWRNLPMTRGFDLLDGVTARIEDLGLGVTTKGDDLFLRCDGYEVVALLSGLAGWLAKDGQAGDFTLEVAAEGAGAMLDLGWAGPPLALRRLDEWLGRPVDPGSELTGRDVLANHATECWPEPARNGRARLRLPLSEARQAGPRPRAVARKVVYDFDLLFKARGEKIADMRLEDLTYVVFDSETTGLLPLDGDEVVQLAAVRIVNGRQVRGEVFDTLVNPGRTIPPRSTDVHGITDAMVADAPDMVAAARRFHRFAQGAVLVAHNTPFDMAFLRRREAEIGAVFDNPILDTVLLSAVVFGQDDAHSLDALTQRLGITIPEAARHTALGDTVATAEALLKLLPMLKARGIITFGDVLAEVRRHGRLLKDLNA
jgi:DNA polymerase III subunit epsilon